MNKNLYTTGIALIVSIGGLLLGISATISGASEFYRNYFDITLGSFWEGFAVGIAMLGTFIGNFFAGSIGDKMGRKKALLVAAVLFGVCTVGSGLATNYPFFLFTRFIGGLGIGISLLVAPLFIAEFSPSEKRGFLVSFNQMNIGIGYLLAYLSNTIVLNLVPNPDQTWRWMLGVGIIFPVAYFLMMLLVPESPRWLLMRKKDKQALKVLDKIGGDEYARRVYDEMKNSIEKENHKSTDSFRSMWKELFSKKMNLILFVGFSVAFFQQISGINAVFFFAPKILRMAGFGGSGSFIQANLIGICMVVMTIVSMFLIDRLGRKPLMIIGVSIMIVALAGSSWFFKKASYVVESDDIALISESIIDDAIVNTAQSNGIKNIHYSSIEMNGEKALLMNNDEIVATVELASEEMLRAKNEAIFIEHILTGYLNKTFKGENAFFHLFKKDLEFSIEKYVSTKLESQLFNIDAFADVINAQLSQHVNQKVIAEGISESVYAKQKDRLLDATININSTMLMISIIMVIVGFSISLGPITWTLLSEIFPGKLRGIGISIAGALNGVTSFVVSTIFPIELEHIGAGNTFLIYAIFMIVCLISVLKYYPETKGKTLAQIEKELVRN